MSVISFIESVAVGASAGTTVWSLSYIREKYNNYRDESTIVNIMALEKNRKPELTWRSTKTIASFCNLTEDRVRYICSVSKKIKQSKKTNEVWTLISTVGDSEDS